MPTSIATTKPVALTKPFASNTPVSPGDVLHIKKAMNRLGYYVPPKDIGITDIPDSGIFTAIRNFQKTFGLPITGEIRPGDITLTALNRELAKSGHGYYIWRTVRDEHTRPEHAVLDGSIRSWKNFPNPGDDFNCRCWAEAAPDITREEFIGWQKEAFEKIKAFERTIPYPYLDSKGVVTVGTGINVDDKSKFMGLDFRVGTSAGRKAPLVEKEAAFYSLKTFAKQETSKAPTGSVRPVNKSASFYKTFTNLRLSEEQVDLLYRKHFKQTLTKEIPHAFPKFSTYPDEAKIVIMDMMFNMGPTRFTKEKWPSFFESLNKGDWKRAGVESHRKDIEAKRNDWARDMLKGIKKE
jgi:GH24 family phage-related lysozyme (muramidase)